MLVFEEEEDEGRKSSSSRFTVTAENVTATKS